MLEAGPAERAIPVPRGYDLDGSLGIGGVAFLEPTARRSPGAFLACGWTPAGPATLRVSRGRDHVRAEAWGAGGGWSLERAPSLLGLGDDPAAFVPARPPRLRTLARRLRGVHLPRTPWVFDTLAGVILQQRVRFRDAARSHRRLVERFGEPAPGPDGLRLPLSPGCWLRLSSDDFRRADVDGQRARALRAAAREARRIDATFGIDLPSARQTLASVHGCGPWTVEMTMGLALGDPDAVPTGDLHLPAVVAWALAGELRADDRRMLELLEPYRGHRFRLLRLLLLTKAPVPRVR
ncbi:MAG TPA: DNA-3-methyladenine glycosylase 2 family protein [Vicinamibacteria bacterium]|nr:DNA-3-methyladenine glycosylase 2 family protein [Vicinamibacteria bacterium]